MVPSSHRDKNMLERPTSTPWWMAGSQFQEHLSQVTSFLFDLHEHTYSGDMHTGCTQRAILKIARVACMRMSCRDAPRLSTLSISSSYSCDQSNFQNRSQVFSRNSRDKDVVGTKTMHCTAANGKTLSNKWTRATETLGTRCCGSQSLQ